MKIPAEVKISDNGFVFNSKTGDSFSLNPTGLELIRMVAEEMSLEDIKEKFIEKYDVDDLSFERDFYEFCTLLKHFQITSQSDSLEFN